MQKIFVWTAAGILGLSGLIVKMESDHVVEKPHIKLNQILEDFQNSTIMIKVPYEEPKWAGSGFPIHKDAAYTYILTVHHVTCDQEDSKPFPFVRVIETHKSGLEIDGYTKGFPAQVYRSWAKPEDMVLLRVSRKIYNPPYIFKLESAAFPSLGETVYSIGSPKCQLGFLSSGIISSNVKVDNLSYINTTNISVGGCSGGPIINAEGKVCGIIQKGGGENLSLGLSSKSIRRLLDEAGLRDFGR